MFPLSPVAGRLVTGSFVCAVHVAALAWIGVELAAEKTLQGGAPVIQLTLEGYSFAGEASMPQQARSARAEREQSRSRTPSSNASRAIVSPRPQAQPTPQVLSAPTPSRSLSAVPSAETASRAAPSPGPSPSAAEASGASTTTSTASPSPGAGAPLKGASGDPAQDPYEAQVIAWLERHKRHPGGVAGRILVRFSLDRRGRLLRSSVISGEGEKRLEQVALSQLEEAAPFPRPPSGTTWSTRTFIVRLDYRSDQP